MSSKRGRKRNDNLPPNRARDVQRAFRARRAAHLLALEQRVSELEDENDCLRQALNLPPANRQILGKGPTGKDKPKVYESPGIADFAVKSRDSSESPPTTRLNSHSPVRLDESISSWDDANVMNESPTGSTTYPLPPMSSSPPLSKPLLYNPYPSSSSSRSSSVSAPAYSHYSHSADRSVVDSYPSPNFAPMRIDQRDEHRPQYHYPSSTYDSPVVHSPSPAPLNTQSYPSRGRSMPDPLPYTIDSGFPHLPHPLAHQGIRLPSPPRLQDVHGCHPHYSSPLPGPRHLYSGFADNRATSSLA